jgi:hypothetical protein
MANLQNESSNWVKVFITSAYDDPEPITSMLKDAALDKVKKYKVVDDPDLADVILFVENSRYHADYFFSRLKRNPLVKKYPQKVYMYNAHDKPWLVLPGLYASMPKRFFNKDYIAAVPYIESINPYIKYDPAVKPEFLFSFIGSPNSPPRRNILRLKHPRGVAKPSGNNMFANGDLKDVKLKYAESLVQSKFILCPRGAGTSSFRIFETMQAGRVPVIISDDWVAPDGPNWNEFALFIPERGVDRIPMILEQEEVNWPKRSELSRKAWESFFAPDVKFNYMLESILRLKKNYSNVGVSIHLFHYIPYLKYVFRALVIQKLKVAIANR